MGSKGVVWRPIATIAAAVGDVELEDQVLRLSRYLGYAKVLLNNFYFLGGGPALKKLILPVGVSARDAGADFKITCT